MKYSFLFTAVIILLSCVATKPAGVIQSPPGTSKAKIVVGITVDQMRYDYIDKFWNDYSEDGFKRLLREGFFARNLKYNYMPTLTAPGHASIFTGTTPCIHGILVNDRYERSSGKIMYCTGDSTVQGVGTLSKAGQMSPHYLTASTIGDELRQFTNERAKVFGISMKDRGAILPAGRTADAAFWFEGGTEGNWISSTWYMPELPQWVKGYNEKHLAADYMNQTWTLSKPETDYLESMQDNNQYEGTFKGLLKPVFPYELKSLASANGNYDMIKETPFGNALTIDFAKALIENEKLGQDDITDMLCMSFSSTDYVGHRFGIHSRELQDCYIKLDLEIAGFLKYMDEKFGQGNYLIFLTADHGGTPTPSYVSNDQGSGGYWKSDKAELFIEDELAKKYGAGDWVLNESNQNFYFNHKLIADKNLELNDVQDYVAFKMLSFPEVSFSFTSHDLMKMNAGHMIREMVQNGFSPANSGDVIYVLRPGFMEYGMTGTHHGAPFDYDSHVPAIFFGAGIQQGESFEPHTITDVVPTVAAALRIPFTNGGTGKPITEALRK